jgi:hypothetical protein
MRPRSAPPVRPIAAAPRWRGRMRLQALTRKKRARSGPEARKKRERRGQELWRALDTGRGQRRPRRACSCQSGSMAAVFGELAMTSMPPNRSTPWAKPLHGSPQLLLDRCAISMRAAFLHQDIEGPAHHRFARQRRVVAPHSRVIGPAMIGVFQVAGGALAPRRRCSLPTAKARDLPPAPAGGRSEGVQD